MKKVEFSNFGIKFMLIFIMVLLFLIPIHMIKDLIEDRQDYKDDAIESIIVPLGKTAGFQGISIAVPYKFHKESVDSNGNRYTESETKYVIFAPDSYKLDFDVNPYHLTRGIFKVPVFNGQIQMEASFDNFDFTYFNIEKKDVMLKDAVLIMGISNPKNITSQPNLTINGLELPVSPIKYDSISPFSTSIYYTLSGIDFSKKLNLEGIVSFQGGEKIRIRPIASDNTINMTSSWKSPSFSGGWLPQERHLDDNGFSAMWSIAGLSTVFPKSWLAENTFSPESVEVSFIVPVDAYQKTTRSVKYALLFLVIPFVALMVCEVFSKIRIHPIQYGLIGFADIMFYLLLLSISEHITFDLTYLICSLSVCVTTLLYAMVILKNLKWGILLSLVQFVSYIFLYGTLQAEDYALLIGSLGLFTVVVLLMFITRKIDWYEITKKKETAE